MKITEKNQKKAMKNHWNNNEKYIMKIPGKKWKTLKKKTKPNDKPWKITFKKMEKTMKSNENLWKKKWKKHWKIIFKKINDKTLKKQWQVMKISEKNKNEQPLKKYEKMKKQWKVMKFS
jgi:hypothetical protein